MKWDVDGSIYLSGNFIKGTNIIRILENIIRTNKKTGVIGYERVYDYLVKHDLLPAKYIAKSSEKKKSGEKQSRVGKWKLY